MCALKGVLTKVFKIPFLISTGSSSTPGHPPFSSVDSVHVFYASLCNTQRSQGQSYRCNVAAATPGYLITSCAVGQTHSNGDLQLDTRMQQLIDSFVFEIWESL